MSDIYRTITWTAGSGFLMTLILAQIDSWFNIDWEIMRWILVGLVPIAMLFGYFLDKYYKSKEKNKNEQED